MPTNNYPGIGYTTYGRDWNYFQKITVTTTTFGGDSVDGYQPTIIIPFMTQSVMFLNLTASGTSGSVVEFSFNGTQVHGELDPKNASIGLSFDNRVVSKVWFRVQAGSTGPISVSVQAWSTR